MNSGCCIAHVGIFFIGDFVGFLMMMDSGWWSEMKGSVCFRFGNSIVCMLILKLSRKAGERFV